MKKKPLDMPNIEQLEAELARTRYKSRYRSVLRSTVYTLIVVAAIAVLVATVWLPVLQIYGSSMTPTLDEEDIVISIKGSQFQQGDLIAFYVGNKILVKRAIALPGQTVDIDEEGNVYYTINGKKIEYDFSKDIKIIVKAYGIQSEGFANATDAWAAFN